MADASDIITLYTNPNSRGRIARWMLEEVGAAYETVILEYGTSMKAPEFLAINPMGKVPTITRGDTVVTECAAICLYLADAFPQAELAPPLGDRAAYYRWMAFACGPMEAAVINLALGVEVPEEKRRMAGYGCFDDTLNQLELALDVPAFLCGERFTAVDVYMGAYVNWWLQFEAIPRRAVFEAYAARATDRDAFRRAMALDDADGAALAKTST